VRTKRRRSLRRVWRVIAWPLSGHVALALATGLACGTVASRYPGAIEPPYAAILGTLILYPVMVTAWWRLNSLGGRR
jgi:uncharacterized protein (DUF2062 family)